MSIIYIFSKLFTYLLLPPGIFIIALFVAAWYAKRFQTLLLSLALTFYLLSNSFVADAMLKSLEAPYNKAPMKAKNIDAVVVLAGGSVSNSTNFPLGTDAFKRALWGLSLAKAQNLPLLFSGGGLDHNNSESKAFLQSVQELNHSLDLTIPISDRLIPGYFNVSVEDKSLDTMQNARFSKAIFDKAGIQKPLIYLVTSAYHMRRAMILYHHVGFRVIPAATDIKIGDSPRTVWDYFPNMSALRHSYLALHEYFGILSLALRNEI
ncbi:YdcF family protein [Sulfurospirillum sp. 1612]|uniref:YdcF family protein n=1 Tax=Sulfurospirillum sp. 1612 TaxID=3094835 RepID=UPI002F94D85D